MALITCPECHRSEVSDSAEQCPNCGYAIKEHFLREKRKREYAEEKRMLPKKIQQEEQRLQPELEKELADIDKLPYPEKPSFFKILFRDKGGDKITFILLFSFALACMIPSVSLLFCSVVVVVLLISVPLILFSAIVDYNAAVRSYKIKTADWENYKELKKEEINNKYKSYAENIVLYGSKTGPELTTQVNANIPKCPVCGSTNIQEISGIRRTASVALVGLASSDLGKQMECGDCGYKF